MSKPDSCVLKLAVPDSGAVHEYHTVLSGVAQCEGSPGSPVERTVTALRSFPVGPASTVGLAKLSFAGEFCAHCSPNAP